MLLDPQREMGHVAYVETYFPRFHFGWHPLRGLRDGRYKLIQASRAELYDLAADPGEKADIVAGERAARRADARGMESLAPAGQKAPEPASLDPAARERLAALGYAGGVADVKEGARLPDPREKVEVYALMTSAKAAANEGRLKEAIALMRTVVEKDPDIMDAHVGLGDWLLRSGQPAAAVAAYKRALALKVDDEVAFGKLVAASRAAGDEREALRALEVFRAGLDANPRNPQAWYELALKALELGQTKAARGRAFPRGGGEPAPRPRPQRAGRARLREGEIDVAEKRVREALAISPGSRPPATTWGACSRRGASSPRRRRCTGPSWPPTRGTAARFSGWPRSSSGKGDEAGSVATLRRCLAQAPESGGCHLLLAHERLRAGDIEEAMRLARRGLELEPASEISPLGHYVLADIYRGRGQASLASTELARARRLQAAAAGRSGSD